MMKKLLKFKSIILFKEYFFLALVGAVLLFSFAENEKDRIPAGMSDLHDTPYEKAINSNK